MHHKIARLQGQGVDLVAALGGLALGLGDVADAVARQIRFGDDHQRQRLGVFELAHLGKDEAGMAHGLVERHLPRRGFPARRGGLGANSLLGEAVDHALDGTFGRGDERRAAAGLGVREQLGHHRVDFFDVAARGRARLEVDGQGERLVGGEHPRRGEGPQRQTGVAHGIFQVVEGTVARRLQVEPLDGDGAVRTHGGGLPPGLQELAVGVFQVRNAGADLLRRDQDDVGICRQKLRQGDHGRVGELRQERLHALCRDLLRDPGQQLHQSRVARVLLGELAGALSHGIGNRQLPRRVDGHLADVDIVDGALVRHGELADIRDLVAPELHAHRVVQGGGKDIEDAAADGVLAALGHHVHVRVGT